jgi:hypothetical protein
MYFSMRAYPAAVITLVLLGQQIERYRPVMGQKMTLVICHKPNASARESRFDKGDQLFETYIVRFVPVGSI